MIKLAIDAMGGDFAPEITVKGAIKAIEEFPDLELVLYGDETIIKPLLTKSERITLVHSPRKIDMGEKDPVHEIRENKDTSLVMSFKAVKDKEVDGVVTAGPTQGVIIAAFLVIRRLAGMKRVALCPSVPSFKDKGALLLDVGANTQIDPEHLLQFAAFADIYAKEVKGVDDPKVYLLNIGTEPGKGRDLEKATFKLLEESSLNFQGNLEPKELLVSDADIIITDGFTGNIAMKTFEGVAKGMGKALKEDISSTFFGKIGYLFMRKNLNRFKKRFDAEEIGGAILFGVDGVVVKAHGGSSAYAFFNAIRLARRTVAGDVIGKMRGYLNEHPIDRE